MSRRVQYFDLNFSKRELFAVFSIVNFVVCFGLWAINDRCIDLSRQIDMPGNKISVEVRFKNVFDRCSAPCSEFRVGFGFPQGIDDRRCAVRLDIISRLCKTICIELLDVHDLSFFDFRNLSYIQ